MDTYLDACPWKGGIVTTTVDIKARNRRSSEIIEEITQDIKSNGKLTYQVISQKLGNRAFGLALLFFTIPSALPFSAIPGISFIFSFPIAIFALQLIFARKHYSYQNLSPIGQFRMKKLLNLSSKYYLILKN
ncbi:exopolysaccharide biosynthesis protein [Coxiella-like endosymbiont of Rhipicephalus sanguineus]|uniref:exopolysaccharide biosynthesis protein n=1 Tax=Coxiella-like endosymbiont of Rhipicephalus sanguineus TaxID=1955402 RepID=UPI00203D974F|nr:exopolysaccharide biosynthesis protein [Coxiella-like endosymbiont of Rhipicephalus sanguineus]